MKQLRQIAHAFQIGIVTTLARPRHIFLTTFGLLVAGVIVLVLLTIPAGLKRLAGRTGLPDVALVLPSHSLIESSGALQPNLVRLIGTLPGIAHTSKGQPMVAPQFVVDTRLQRLNGTTATVIVRGVTPIFWKVVGGAVAVKSGSRPKSGIDQLLAGVAVARGFVALHTGDTIAIHKTPWHVSGEFTAGGGFWQSELWANMADLQATYDAQGRVTSVWVKLVSPAAFADFANAKRADARLNALQVLRQREYYTRQTGFLDVMARTGMAAVAIALGLGAILATINALGMALAARRRELAVLRAIGFEQAPLAIALLFEVLVTAMVCTGIVVLIGWLLVDGRDVGTSTVHSAIQFRLHVGGGVIWWTLIYLLALAVMSAVWPVCSAVRAPLTGALQDE